MPESYWEKVGIAALGAAFAVAAGILSFAWQTSHKARSARRYLRADISGLIDVLKRIEEPFIPDAQDAHQYNQRFDQTKEDLDLIGWFSSNISRLDLTREAGYLPEVRELRRALQKLMGPLERLISEMKKDTFYQDNLKFELEHFRSFSVATREKANAAVGALRWF